jgi:hypothetical protein
MGLQKEERFAVQDDEQPSDGFMPIDDPGLSNEDYYTIIEQRHPSTSQWRNLSPPLHEEMPNISIYF